MISILKVRPIVQQPHPSMLSPNSRLIIIIIIIIFSQFVFKQHLAGLICGFAPDPSVILLPHLSLNISLQLPKFRQSVSIHSSSIADVRIITPSLTFIKTSTSIFHPFGTPLNDILRSEIHPSQFSNRHHSFVASVCLSVFSFINMFSHSSHPYTSAFISLMGTSFPG